MEASLALVKFAGLIRSGVEMPKAITIIGGLPKDKNLRFLLEVALETGSAVNFEIDLVADQFGFQERSIQRIQTLQAAPQASARLVIWLPFIVLAVAWLAGLEILSAVRSNPVILGSFLFGVLLLISARWATSKMIRRAKPFISSTGFYLLALAMNVSASGSLVRAQNRCEEIYLRVFGVNPPSREMLALAEITHLVEQTGAPAGELLRRQAEILQREELSKLEQRIEKLSIRLLVPLGIAVLPAFVLIALLPLSVSMLAQR